MSPVLELRIKSYKAINFSINLINQLSINKNKLKKNKVIPIEYYKQAYS